MPPFLTGHGDRLQVAGTIAFEGPGPIGGDLPAHGIDHAGSHLQIVLDLDPPGILTAIQDGHQRALRAGAVRRDAEAQRLGARLIRRAACSAATSRPQPDDTAPRELPARRRVRRGRATLTRTDGRRYTATASDTTSAPATPIFPSS